VFYSGNYNQMTDFNKPSTIALSCPKGISAYLEAEVKALGFRPEETRETGLELKGSLTDCIRLNLNLRTAHRVHYLLGETRADTPDQLYGWLKGFSWEKIIPKAGYVAVTSRVNHHTIKNTQFANLKVKDAIVDRIREKTGSRPAGNRKCILSILCAGRARLP
jgi:23S rRNA G2445 N2-methylase RlmL